MLSQFLSRRLSIAVLKARDPGALTFEEGYEIYRADLARDLRAADREFHGGGRPSLRRAAIAAGGNGALLLAVAGATTFAQPMRRACEAWTAGGLGPAALAATAIAAGGLVLVRRIHDPSAW